jgi:simple sugar transport system permease protein
MTSKSETKEVQSVQRPAPSRSRVWARRYGLQIGTLAIGLAIWSVFVIGAPAVFLSPQIYQAFMSTTPFFAIMALPLTLVVITGEIDLSFPSIMAISMTTFSIVLERNGNVWLAFALCLLTGWLVGLLNGVIVVKLGIPSLIATIGMQFVWRGAVNIINGGNGSSLVPVRDTALYNLLVGRGLGIPAQMIWTVLIAIAMWVLLNRTKFGAHLYLVGDNIDSARLMGIPVDARKMLVFAIMGLGAAFAGLCASLEVSYFWPSLGEGFLLKTISSVFMGGTSVFGGVGSIMGTFVGSFIIGAIEAGVVAIGLSGFWTQFIYGLIIVISVAFQMFLSRKLK